MPGQVPVGLGSSGFHGAVPILDFLDSLKVLQPERLPPSVSTVFWVSIYDNSSSLYLPKRPTSRLLSRQTPAQIDLTYGYSAPIGGNDVCRSAAKQIGLFSSSNDLGISFPACYGIASSITRMHGLWHDSKSCQRLGTPHPSDPGSSIQTLSPWVAPSLVRPACTSPSVVCSNIGKASHLLRSNTRPYSMESCFHILQNMTAQILEARHWTLVPCVKVCCPTTIDSRIGHRASIIQILAN